MTQDECIDLCYQMDCNCFSVAHHKVSDAEGEIDEVDGLCWIYNQTAPYLFVESGQYVVDTYTYDSTCNQFLFVFFIKPSKKECF
jgi:hypothetical protein